MRWCVNLIAAALLLATPGCSEASGPVKLWELSGFENPESVLPSADGKVLYVSNVAGAPDQKDGKGFISKISPDGKMVSLKWIEGLNAPKGMAETGGKLYVANIDELVEVDVKDGKIIASHAAAGAKFLNDVVADAQGRVYVSDMVTNRIWRLESGKLDVFIEGPALKNPNGLHLAGDNLIVAAWGVMTDGFATKVPGNLLTVSLADKSIKDLGDGTPIGNLDGLEPLGGGDYLVSDWMAGKVFRIASSGKAEVLLSLSPGTADLGFDPKSRTMFLPMMKDNKVIAYTIP